MKNTLPYRELGTKLKTDYEKYDTYNK